MTGRLSVSLLTMLKVWFSLIVLYFYQQAASLMSSIKIPELNLYRGKRTNKTTHYQMVQKEGVNLLAKSKNKELLHQIKAQLYLDTYKSNLSHFVSPTKYRQQAQTYLKSSKADETLLVGAISFPRSRHHCVNCFSSIKQDRKCPCETQTRVNTVLKLRSSERKPEEELPRANKHRIEHIQRIAISGNRRDTQASEVNLKAQAPITNDREEGEAGGEVTGIKGQAVRDISNIALNREAYRSQQKGENASNPLMFRENLEQHQHRLDDIDLSLADSSHLSIDFNDLIQAKRQYISKSKDILHSLDRIIHSSKGQE